MSGQEETLASILLYKSLIPCKNKLKKNSKFSSNKGTNWRYSKPQKISHEDAVIDAEKGSQHKTPLPFQNKENYEDDTNENNCYADDSQTGSDDCVKKLDKEQKNKDNEEFQKDFSVASITNELTWSKSKKEQAPIKSFLAISLPLKIT